MKAAEDARVAKKAAKKKAKAEREAMERVEAEKAAAKKAAEDEKVAAEEEARQQVIQVCTGAITEKISQTDCTVVYHRRYSL